MNNNENSVCTRTLQVCSRPSAMTIRSSFGHFNFLFCLQLFFFLIILLLLLVCVIVRALYVRCAFYLEIILQCKEENNKERKTNHIVHCQVK